MLDRIFISSDIEGTCGICHWDETELGKTEYEPFRRQMTAEVSAACEGAFAGGCDDILIKDAHDSARNLLPAELPQNIQIFRGWGSDIHSMMSGIDASFAGAIFTGYHSPSNFDTSPLAHGFLSRLAIAAHGLGRMDGDGAVAAALLHRHGMDVRIEALGLLAHPHVARDHQQRHIVHRADERIDDQLTRLDAVDLDGAVLGVHGMRKRAGIKIRRRMIAGEDRAGKLASMPDIIE